MLFRNFSYVTFLFSSTKLYFHRHLKSVKVMSYGTPFPTFNDDMSAKNVVECVMGVMGIPAINCIKYANIHLPLCSHPPLNSI